MGIPKRLNFRCVSRDYENHVAFMLWYQDEDGNRYIANPVVFEKEYNAGTAFYREPTFAIDYRDCQQVMDELWRLRLRPADYTSNDKVSAINRHLEDMRQLAFSKLKVSKP